MDGLDLIPDAALAEVIKVLKFGEKKHGEAWKTQTIEKHRLHGSTHAIHSTFETIREQESGLPHLAHAVCRYLFALELQLQAEKRDSRL